MDLPEPGENSEATESNTESQSTCHHFTSPHTCKSLYHKNSYSSTKSCNHGYYRICNICNNSNFIASFLACQHCSEYDCYCQCRVCGGPHPETKCGYASRASPFSGSPSSWSDTHNNQDQTDHESEDITSTDCKERNLEQPSDPTNTSYFSTTETVETTLWDEGDDGWMLKTEEDYWLNQAKTNNSISVNMQTQTDCEYDSMDYQEYQVYSALKASISDMLI